MILRKGKITQDLVNPASAGENLAQHIIRAFLSRLCLVDRRGFSQERPPWCDAIGNNRFRPWIALNFAFQGYLKG